MAAASSKKVIYAALVGNSLIAITKFAASVHTGSSAMLSEAIHSLVDTGNQLLLLYGLRRAGKPADRTHPFGYGRELYFWAFVVALLIFSVGAGVSIYEGVHKVRHPEVVTSPHINYIVLSASILFEAFALGVAIREFNKIRGDTPIWTAVRESKDPAIFTVVFEDAAAMAGLLIALFGLLAAQYFGLPWLDGAASIGIGIVLALVAVLLCYETKALIIGEAADAKTIEAIHRIASASDAVMTVNELRTMHMGPHDILLALSLDVHDNLESGYVEDAVYDIEKAIRAELPDVKRLYVEIQNASDHAETAWSQQHGT